MKRRLTLIGIKCRKLADKFAPKQTASSKVWVAYRLAPLFFSVLILAFSQFTYAQEEEAPEEVLDETKVSPLSEEVEDLKKAALNLNRDLLILEEELLFPANTQIVVFVSMDTGEFFAIDAIKLSIDDKLVASHLYTHRQNDALSRGGIQRLYMGNLKSGEHELTAIFTGVGPDHREYKRGATMLIEKDDDPKMVEIQIRDSSKTMQPEFGFKEWEL